MENPINSIKDKVCVVTGACGVFGNAFASGLLDAGAKVAIIDYKKGRCEDCAMHLAQKAGAKVLCVLADVLNREMLLEAKREINGELGKIDVLVNVAGGNSPAATTTEEFINLNNFDEPGKSFFGLSIEGFRNVFDLNFLGTVLPSMIFAEDMINRNGTIINISSMSAFRSLTRVPAYSASKASINNFTQWLAVHLSKVGIRVNAIAPGFFVTNQNQFLLYDENKKLTKRGNRIIDHTPMGRFGQPEDLLGTLYYLASDMSSFLTGVVIPVDGGFNAYSGV